MWKPDPNVLADEYVARRYASKFMGDEERGVVVAALRLYAKAEEAKRLFATEELAGGALEGNS